MLSRCRDQRASVISRTCVSLSAAPCAAESRDSTTTEQSRGEGGGRGGGGGQRKMWKEPHLKGHVHPLMERGELVATDCRGQTKAEVSVSPRWYRCDTERVLILSMTALICPTSNTQRTKTWWTNNTDFQMRFPKLRHSAKYHCKKASLTQPGRHFHSFTICNFTTPVLTLSAF